MKKPGKNIVGTVTALIAPTADALGFILWDVEYTREGTEWYLRITIDKPEGITIDDCETFHRAIDPLLDEADPIEGSYRLEVSSPGIERELRCDAHLSSSLGTEVQARLYAPINGVKSLRGILTQYNEENIIITQSGQEVSLRRADIAKLNTVFNFD